MSLGGGLKSPALFSFIMTIKSELLLTFLAVFFLLIGIRDAQHHPRFVSHYVAGRLVSSELVTNPVYYSYTNYWVVSSNGLELTGSRVTNSYWPVWKWLE